MQLLTHVPVIPLEPPISYQAKVFSMGSCFAEHMSEKLRYYGFDSDANPFGIIFNAISMQRLVARIVQQQAFTEADIFFHNELWQSYEVHSALSSTEASTYLANLNAQLIATRDCLEKATHCIFTLGTSWVYTHQGNVVANCHKVPNSQFEKKLLSAEENQIALQKIKDCIHQINPNLQFIFTVSPVRHTKDGFTENHISKGNLLQAIDNVQQSTNDYYFPAYEIVMDELRDYRFFAADMIHPNSLAIDYIWERFSTHAIESSCEPIMKELAEIKRALHHRPQHQNTQAWAQFQHQLEQKIANFKQRFPDILLEQ
ncbi:GSCFA family protein [Flavobacterium fontis]|uniref:GSCFA family protein n=1 Tax=Flavobacterium fontis TaxID=1124188 RepID=A0A1M5CVT6_9FLAO|nr:GSCFA domain-containing protein [Flavobacterium fontis]SHF58880.1 GSCFA family protein [Flavobacterium fontis]